MTELANPNRLIQSQRFLTHLRSNDTEQAIAMLSENVKYHVIGDHALAGTFVGPNAVMDHLMNMANRTVEHFDLVKWEDLMLGVQHVAALVDTHVEAKGMSFAGRLLILFKFDVVDKIEAVTIFFEDVLAAERFYGRA